jgi:putative transposase
MSAKCNFLVAGMSGKCNGVLGIFLASCFDRIWTSRSAGWRDGRSTPALVVNLLRQIEAAVASGKTTSLSCNELEIAEQTYSRWRKEYGGLQVDQARRLKELASENAKLKRLVSELRASSTAVRGTHRSQRLHA